MTGTVSGGAIRRALASRDVRVALSGLGFIVVLAVFGSLFTPYDPLSQDPAALLQPPSWQHLLGTDYIGRDVLSRLLAGSRLSVLAAVEAVAIGMVLGVIPGVLSVYVNRPLEWLSLRITDAVLALPFIVFAIAFAALLGNGLHQAMIAVGILTAPTFFRVTRAAVGSLGTAQYIEAAQLLGASVWWIVTRHVWSKVAPTVAVTGASALGGALLVVSSLTFLGIGVQPPEPTWGGMLASDLRYLSQRPYGPIAPALLIMITVGSLNLLADSIRDVFARAATVSAAVVPVERDLIREVNDDARRS
ncbi:MAG: peptide transporter permease [Cryobacterium sp.]|jgi:peptide/nickel transport system permease protein|nr:peptide transporter permease [Cryobacterium sp.]